MYQHLLLMPRPIPTTKTKLPLFSPQRDPRSTSSLLLTLAQNPEYFLSHIACDEELKIN